MAWFKPDQDIIVPADALNIPLFSAFGITEKESNEIYFQVANDIIPRFKTVAQCLKAIADKQGWSDKFKVWAAYHLKTELLAQKGVPKKLLEKLESF